MTPVFVGKKGMLKRDKILQAVKTRLVAAFGDKIKDVVLFGSRAWGQAEAVVGLGFRGGGERGE